MTVASSTSSTPSGKHALIDFRGAIRWGGAPSSFRHQKNPAAGSARLQADAGLHGAVPQPDRADSDCRAVLQDLHADVGAVCFRRHVAARHGVVPADVWRVADCRAGELGVWPVAGLGVGALQVSGQKTGRCTGRFAVCAAYGCRRHFADGAAGRQRLAGPVPGADGHQAGIHTGWCGDCADFCRHAVCGAHGAAGA